MFCSPTGNQMYSKHRTCFSKEALVRLAEAWNDTNPTNKIRSYKKRSKMDLWGEINDKMAHICGRDSPSKEACWADNLHGTRPAKEVAKSLRPIKPSEWKEDEYTWLTNYDIEAVMNQYDFDVHPRYSYKFLGVFPIDFQAKTAMGQCLFQEFCALDILRMYKRGIKYIGMITNLDKHHESGSHWTSLFICIDPKSPAFGAYYYDSVASVPPREIVNFIETVKSQVSNTGQFRVKYNKMRHQKGNTECGVFSIDYQIRWITALLKNKNTTFEDVTALPQLTDSYIHKYRNIYFRPYQQRKTV